jgi:hypothetical protein
MEETTTFADPVPMAGPTYTDPISSFFGGIFMIIVLVLIIILFGMAMVGRLFGLVKDAPAQPPAQKEKFRSGPPYPRCQTNGSFAMF